MKNPREQIYMGPLPPEDRIKELRSKIEDALSMLSSLDQDTGHKLARTFLKKAIELLDSLQDEESSP